MKAWGFQIRLVRFCLKPKRWTYIAPVYRDGKKLFNRASWVGVHLFFWVFSGWREN